MKIIIPMSGFGERFRRAGYTLPKPLIEIEGKPIIKHVLDMFPGETDVIFICNQEHLDEPAYRMREILISYCPTASIIGIKPHKLGPVYAVQKVFDQISDDGPVIVNYCDFTCYWNYEHFKEWLKASQCDGCVPAYRGFHPHTLGVTNYAYMRESNGWMEDIQEKQPFTEDRMQEYASSGTYYFSSGSILKKYFNQCIEQKLSVNDEYYVSLVYKPMLEDGLKISVYGLQHFMQWGTPEDVMEYRYWSDIFKGMVGQVGDDYPMEGANLIPMVGEGSRFVKEGYSESKPLLAVSGSPMYQQAHSDLPKAKNDVFVIRNNMAGYDSLVSSINETYKKAKTVVLNDLTDGQASTCLEAVAEVDQGQPLVIAACDNGMIYDRELYRSIMDDEDVDVIIWGARGYPGAVRNPHMYGWIDIDDDGIVRHVSVKKQLDDVNTNPIITGTFTFKKATDFVRSAESMINRDGRVNGEFYVDSCINDAIDIGFKCKVFMVDSYICWGTPNDLRTFEYWQSCFHKWNSHPYLINNDLKVPRMVVEDMVSRYKSTQPSALC